MNQSSIPCNNEVALICGAPSIQIANFVAMNGLGPVVNKIQSTYQKEEQDYESN